MSHPEEFGEMYHRDPTGFNRRWFVWAEVDPNTFEINFIYLDNTSLGQPPFKGYKPSECTDGVKKAAFEHVQKCIAASREIVDSEENIDVIDYSDIPPFNKLQ